MRTECEWPPEAGGGMALAAILAPLGTGDFAARPYARSRSTVQPAGTDWTYYVSAVSAVPAVEFKITK